MRKLLVLVCALTLALVAAGCGSSGGSDSSGDDPTTTKAESTTTAADDGDTTTTEGDGDVEPTDLTAEDYEAAFVTSFTSGSREDGNLVLPDDVAECVAPKFVEVFTVEQLNEAGIDEEDASDPGFDPADVGLDEEQARATIQVFADCDFDLYAELAASLTVGMDPAVSECAAENVDHDLADALLVASFSGGESTPAFEAFLADLQESCDLPDA